MTTKGTMALDPAVSLAARDLMGRYVWALDRGDVDQVLGLFVDDEPTFIDTRENVHTGRDAVRASFAGLIADPDFRGRTHVVTYLFEEQEDRKVVLTSYWVVVKWSFDANKKEIFSMGHARDTLVLREAGWRIAERKLGWLTEQHGPWVGLT